ncbi:hypothetical protein BC831DRAFT_469726 [Entophlyctis helioformis]|nr:hypothetical protein BC831DRAFT_469726 [Entophlyctis helioformis]
MPVEDKSVHKIEVAAADAPVCAATVFSDRAEVSRILTVDLKGGPNQVSLTGVAWLDEDTIRVSGVGSATILEVRLESEEKKVVAAEDGKAKSELDTLKERLKSISSAVRRLRLDQETLTEQHSTLDSFAANVIARPAVLPSAAESGSANAWEVQAKTFFGSVAAQHLEMSKGLSIEALDTAVKIEDLEEEQREVQNRIYKLSGRVGGGVSYETVRTIHVTLESPADERVSLAVSYMVNSASWTPSYDIRVMSDTEILELTYKAEISQSTGEEWKNAAIILSTAQASVGGSMANLSHPWLLSFNRPQPTYSSLDIMIVRHIISKCQVQFSTRRRRIWRSSPTTRTHDGDGDDHVEHCTANGCAKAKGPAGADCFEAGHDAATFQIPTRNTIPSDGVGHKVTVAIIELKPSLSFSTVPKLAERAFLKAIVKNTSEYVLLEGACAIYLDSSFVAKSTLGKTVSPLDTFEVSLGVDPGITVTYGPLKKQLSGTGASLLGNKQTVVRFSRQITIKNAKRIPIAITLQDQIPLSQDDKINVLLVQPPMPSVSVFPTQEAAREAAAQGGSYTPLTSSISKIGHRLSQTNLANVTASSGEKPIVLFQDMNVLEFRLAVVAGESRDVPIKYDVTYPDKETVVGLYD